MNRADTFTFRVNTDERQLLTAVAERLQRTESDAVRWLVREAARELGVPSRQPTNVDIEGVRRDEQRTAA